MSKILGHLTLDIPDDNRIQIQDILQGTYIVKFIELQRLGWCGDTERRNNERMPQKIVTAGMEGTVKRGIPWKIWTDEVEEDLKTV